MGITKYFTCSHCGRSLRENRENFIWFKKADENGKWHRDTCRDCEKEQLIKENVKEENGIKLYKCSICGNWLTRESFNLHVGSDNSYLYRDRLDKRCNKCKQEQNKQARTNYSDEKRLQKILQCRWLGARDRAKHKNKLFDISKEDLMDIWIRQNGKCAISKIPMTYIMDGGRNPYNVSIDQINPSKGYTKDNIQLVCMCVNQLKSDFDMNVVINICKNIIKNYDPEMN